MQRKMQVTVGCLWGLALFLLTMPAVAATQPVKVVVSFSILADLAGQVGGEAVSIKSLVGPDSDAHVYEPTPADAVALKGAQLVVVNGLGYEGWMERLIASSGYKGRVVVAAAGAHAPAATREHPMDPHAWQDVANVQNYVMNIAAGLSQVAPEQAKMFQENARRYGEELAQLHQWVKAEFAAIPLAQRKVISTHDAFGHFARAYGVTFFSPVGMSTDADPSAAGMARLITLMKKENIRGMFLENMADPRLVEQLAREVGAVVVGTLYADALSVASGPVPTYVAMIRHNVTLLKRAMMGK